MHLHRALPHCYLGRNEQIGGYRCFAIHVVTRIPNRPSEVCRITRRRQVEATLVHAAGLAHQLADFLDPGRVVVQALGCAGLHQLQYAQTDSTCPTHLNAPAAAAVLGVGVGGLFMVLPILRHVLLGAGWNATATVAGRGIMNIVGGTVRTVGIGTVVTLHQGREETRGIRENRVGEQGRVGLGLTGESDYTDQTEGAAGAAALAEGLGHGRAFVGG